MFDVFLSHNGRDKHAVEVLANRLKEEAQLEPFLDRWHLLPGGSWQPELEQALTDCPSVAVFFGESGVSPWQHEELQLAITQAVRTRDEYRVIPVLLPGARPEDVKGFLAQRTWVDFRSGLDDADAFNRLVAGIKGQALETGTFRLPDEPAPYRGLLPFDRAHARFFFGRDSEIQTVLDKLKQHPFVAVVGASGAGKSSLVLGGVLPRLEDASAEPGRPLRIRVMTPGGQPLRALANQLATLVPPESRLATADDLTQRLASRAEAFRNAVDTLTAEQPGTFLLVVDQLEELFTHAAPGEAPKDVAAFVSTLRDAVEKGRGSIRVIATLRADFFERCLSLSVLRALIQDHQVLLGSLGPEALRDAIVRPAQAVGAFMEKGLVGTILKDVAQAPGTLPLLEHALYELWRARCGAWLTLSAYEASGGVSGALQRRAQSCYEALKPEEQEIARKLFLRLTTLGEGTPDTRRRVARGELHFPGISPERVEHVLQVLSGPEIRLIIADGDTVEVAHEVLIREWSTLRGWLDENRRELRVHRRLTEAANEWAKHQQDSSYLYTGSRLLEADERLTSNPGPLNQCERDFLAASLALRDTEKRERESRKRREVLRLRVLAGVFAAAAVGIFGFWQQAQRERDNARSRELTTKALFDLKEDPQRSLHLLQEAHRLSPSEDLTAALSAWRREPGLAVLRGHERSVEIADYSPDGSRIVTASQDGTARLWEAASGKLLATLQGHSNGVNAASFSPDGSRIVTASQDGTARVWSATGGKLLAILQGHSGQVSAASFSPDGSRIVTASQDGTARLWEVASGKLLAILQGHSKWVNAAGFSPDGARIITASSDNTARIWEAASGKLLFTLQGFSGAVYVARFSPNGSRIVTACHSYTLGIGISVASDNAPPGPDDGTAHIWDAASGKFLATLKGHSDRVNTAVFSSDGSRIVTTDIDGSTRIWEADSGELLSTLRVHSGGVNAAVFSHDGSRIVTAGTDATALVWEADSGKLLSTLEGHSGSVNAAVFSPDGSRIVTASDDGTARLWEIAGKNTTLLSPHSGAVNMAVFSPDGSRVATTSQDGPVGLWEAASGKRLDTLWGDPGLFGPMGVEGAEFSPDGSRIVTYGTIGESYLWKTDSGRRVTTFGEPCNGASAVGFSPDGSRVITAGVSTACIWKAAYDKEPLAILYSGPGSVVGFNTDGSRLVISGEDGTTRLWESASNRFLATLHSGWSTAVRFSPDGSRIVTASTDGTAQLWEATSGTLLVTLQGPSGQVNAVRFSPDGSRIVTASQDGTARLWEAASGKLLATLQGHSNGVNAASFSPDGSRIVTASQDGTARVWSATGGKLLAILQGHSGQVSAASFSPDGSRIVTASTDGTARIWNCWNWAPVEGQLAHALHTDSDTGRTPTCDARPE